MKRISAFGTLVSAFLIAHPGMVTAQSSRSTPVIEQLYASAVTAVEEERYVQATQLLTRLITLPAHVHSAQSQELLGNVREANGQLAHAVAEYEIYLEKYPDAEGAARVQARLNAILSGARPQPPEPPRAVAAIQQPRPTGRTVRSAARAPARDPSAYTVTDRGNVRLVFRSDSTSFEVEDLIAPAVTEETETESTVTLGLQFRRQMENDANRWQFNASGNLGFDFDSTDEAELRLHEFSAEHLDKASGRIITFGRQRLKPSGVAYRTDGVSLRWPVDETTEIGVFAGTVVNNTRDTLFGNDIYMFGGSATVKGVGPGGDVTVYAVEQRDGSRTDRRAIGVEYTQDFERGSIYANAEYDAKFGQFNRILFTGTRVLENNARLTGRVSYQRSPSLSLQNALIGQTATSIDGLTGTFTESQIEALAVDRSAEITTLSATYYGKFNDSWDLAVDGTIYANGGTPASGGVAATSSSGVQTYAGVRFIGSSIFTERDQVSLGLRHSNTSSGQLVVGSASIRYPYTDALSLRPAVQVGYRDLSGSGGTETFVIPSIDARYRLDRNTTFDIRTGGEFSRTESSSSINTQKSLFFSAGVSRNF